MREEHQQFVRLNFPTFCTLPDKIFQTMKKCVPVVRKIAKGALILLVVLAVVHTISCFVLSRILEGRIAAIKAKGEPVSCAELASPRIPDLQNAAVIYSEIFKTREAAIKSVPGQNANIWSYDCRLIMPEERIKDPSLWDVARRVMAGQEEIFALTEEAVARPKCRFDVNWEAGFGALFPHIIYMRQQVRLLCTKALIDAKDGNMNDAMHNIELAFRVSESLKDEPLLLCQSARWSCVKMASKGLRDVASYGKISKEQADHLSTLLSQIDLRPGLIEGLKGERTMGIWWFDEIHKNPRELFNGSDQKRPSDLIAKAAWFVMRPLIYLDEIYYLDSYASYIEIGQHPYREVVKSDHGKYLWYARISNILLPSSPIFASRDTTKAEIDGSRIFLAIQVYKNKFGNYPASLYDLKSKLRISLPKDPFSGRDFIYHRQPNGYLLYSIGGNMEDDGCAEPGLNQNSRVVGDVAWRE